MAEPGPVREMRLVVTTDDYEEAVRFYRDVLGLPERASFSSPDGRVVILEAGPQSGDQSVEPALGKRPADDEKADRADGGRDREAEDEAAERERGIHWVSFRG